MKKQKLNKKINIKFKKKYYVITMDNDMITVKDYDEEFNLLHDLIKEELNTLDAPNLVKLVNDDIFIELLFYISLEVQLEYKETEYIINSLLEREQFKNVLEEFFDNADETETTLFKELIIDTCKANNVNEFDERINFYLQSETTFDYTKEEIKDFEDNFSITFSGLSESFVYDQTLPQEIIDMYPVGQIIYHPSFIVASPDNDACSTNCRFKIYSAGQWTSFDDSFPIFGCNKNLYINNVTEAFKVIDVYNKEGITQITLINIPIVVEDIIKISTPPVIENFIEESREEFDESFNSENFTEAANLEYNSLAPGIYKNNNDEYQYYTKSDMCNLLTMYSHFEEGIGFDIIAPSILSIDMDEFYCDFLNLLSPVSKIDFEPNNKLIYGNIECNDELSVAYAESILSLISKELENEEEQF